MAITTRTGDTHEEFFIALNKYASFNIPVIIHAMVCQIPF